MSTFYNEQPTPALPLKKVLIANRGEIAVRIARAARDLGIESVAVYSDADADNQHPVYADEAYPLRGESAADTYMNIPALLDIAARSGADCVHPGYGFLAENADFARAVQDAGLVWVGPSPEAIETLGDKVAARQLATKVGAPLAPGTDQPIESWEEARDFAAEHGMPIAIKAAFGGGGRGLKVVHEEADIEEGFASAGREAKAAFGRGECYVEKFLTKPRHVEAQVLADTHGNVRIVGTRDCSVQRRFQKLVEEAPAPFLTDEQNTSIYEGAREICREAGYTGAGTVEFIVAEDGTVSFLEVNTRVQVEHPVTEVISGVDIVQEQFRIAAGLELSFDADPVPTGHAFEFRINAEDAANGFVPCPGLVRTFEPPTGPGIRVDTGVRSGSTIPGSYDSLIAKLIVWGPNRQAALRRSEEALRGLKIEGVRTVIPFHKDIIHHPAFAEDHLDVYTDWVDKEYVPGFGDGNTDVEASYTERTEVNIEIDGKLHRVGLPMSVLSGLGAAPARGSAVSAETAAAKGSAGSAASEPAGADAITSPYAGVLISWKVEDGAEVAEGDTVAIIEAMKMESPVKAPAAGTLRRSDIAEGGSVAQGEVLARIS
ncbi:acetyl/propionyl/methylcrotonyl-CoA carboxylase subunit alpha [Corynebacterium urealyticum]|uniref:acetyl/propionyl/methylcrotonyl-CoA carboxylase subunit alpha n=1 Tax=Corynebacterium urealyticum TaxID=43771 RepID=UPI0011E89F11|nr:biotin carboxylase N-terminal domain-containing protein [Corynebacterium urealyticum]TYR16500.1 ATP-grasp domain-containing protein [Corynebacterium urealyticum]TYT21574.1 ATP-grasp domain-containing protein [Corynebacterium urealyticum]